MNIEISHVSSGYDDFVLQAIDLTIPTRKFTALIGPNGCGKSTLLKTIGRIIKARTGDIKIGDLDVLKHNNKSVAKTISFLPQNPEVPDAITVEQLVGYGRAPHQSILGIRTTEDIALIEQAITTASLTDLRHKHVAQLSGGQRQRAFIAMCLAQNTPYIMLDEPTTFLDIRYQYETLDLIRALKDDGRTSVVVLHDIAQAARYADHLIVMREGEIYATGHPNEIITSDMLRDVYEIECNVYLDPNSNTPVVSPTIR